MPSLTTLISLAWTFFPAPHFRHRAANQGVDVSFVMSRIVPSVDPAANPSQPQTLKIPAPPAVSMSDIQQYLLDYDRDKNDASAVAQASATRTSSIASPAAWARLTRVQD